MTVSRAIRVGLAASVVLLVWVAVPSPSRPVVAAEPAKATDAYPTTVKPLLDSYCNKCHNADKNAAGVALDGYMNTAHARKDRKVWEEVRNQIAGGTMPPKNKPQLKADEKAKLLDWIDNGVLKVDCTAPKDPGRVTVRRLNRAEYNNTIRDLCGVNTNPADEFPFDDVGYGFDNIGDVLSVQPVLLEKYMAAADKVLDAALPSLEPIKPTTQTLRPQNIQVTPRSARIREMINGREVRKIIFTEEGTAFIEKFNFPAAGEYAVRVKAWGTAAGGKAPELTIRIDGRDVKAFAVEAKQGEAKAYEARRTIKNGEFRVAASFTNAEPDKADPKKSRTLGVETIEIEGPIGGATPPMTDAAKLILTVQPKTAADKAAAAEQVIRTFARRAFRRPVSPAEVARLMKLFAVADAQGERFEAAVKLPLKAVLVSPHFLFRIEDDPKGTDETRTLNDHEFATRLSYFLWSSMPDAELMKLADAGALRKPDVLAGQIKRMLADPKVEALTDNFAGQWLMLRNVRTLSPDAGLFPTWDEALRDSIIRETEMFFEHVVRDDRSVLEFLDANYTFVNDRLSYHYGIPNIRGKDFRKVTLADSRRGGVVTHASVLLVTSNPTRTSPVKRGKWVYENILGLTAPPAAPDVPELPPVGEIKGTLRQQFEQHRANPSCANCHAKLDPLGFGLENFDAIGKWRDQDNKQPVDASGVLPDGAKFSGPAELRKVLLGKADLFRRCLAEKLLTFALGRGLEYYDKCTVDELTAKLKAGGDKFSVLVQAIVDSDPFRKRTGKRSE